MAKIIFLDFDGVLNSWESIHEKRLPGNRLLGVDPFHVAKVQRIVDATGAEVVVSSIWRFAHARTDLQRILECAGFTGILRDITPKMHAPERCQEIQTWLDTTDCCIDAFVIVDDESGAEIKDHFVKTEMGRGLQDEHVERAIEILKGGL